MLIGEKNFVFNPDGRKVQRDIQTFIEWETGKISVKSAREQICRNNDHQDEYLNDEEFIFMAHSLGYWHRKDEEHIIKEFKLHERRRKDGIE